MGIEFSRSYKASDGKCYATLSEAQHAEIEDLLFPAADRGGDLDYQKVVKILVENKEKVVNILTITDNSRPKARGMKKPRKPKPNSALPDYTETQRADGVQTAA